jgi:hypothetical protein
MAVQPLELRAASSFFECAGILLYYLCACLMPLAFAHVYRRIPVDEIGVSPGLSMPVPNILHGISGVEPLKRLASSLLVVGQTQTAADPARKR